MYKTSKAALTQEECRKLIHELCNLYLKRKTDEFKMMDDKGLLIKNKTDFIDAYKHSRYLSSGSSGCQHQATWVGANLAPLPNGPLGNGLPAYRLSCLTSFNKKPFLGCFNKLIDCKSRTIADTSQPHCYDFHFLLYFTFTSHHFSFF
jgi:hypothetical protein